jgi:hypothetical protein
MHNEELQNLHSSPNIIWVIKSRGLRWAGQVACVGEMKNVYKISVGKPKRKRSFGRPRLDGRIILE